MGFALPPPLRVSETERSPGEKGAAQTTAPFYSLASLSPASPKSQEIPEAPEPTRMKRSQGRSTISERRPPVP